ncbi:fibronectin type III domain-containing protein, partial [Candidatus Poribacteria bacterium]|nr:fibronectin type III domain-containing protein [Candidatus Poribacteria bacterium]
MKRRLLLLEVLVVLFLNLSSQPLAYDGSAAYDWGDSVPNYNPLAVIMFGSLETSNLTFGDFMGLSPTQPDATSYGDMGVGVGWDDNVVENAGDANTNGDALDGLYVQFYFPDGGWWDLGAETNRIAVFLSQDHGPYLAEGLEVQVYGSNELWGSAGSQALLTDVYLDGWRPHHSEEDANGNGWCSDDIAAVFELLGQYRYIKLTGWDPSLFWDLNEPEVDAVAALSPCVNAPSGLNAQSISLDTIRLNWTDNSSDENGFRVYRDGSFSKELPANTVSNDDTGLAAGTDYCYVVTAFNNACGESIPSNEDCASTCSPPGVPVSINYPSSDSDGSYTISWAAVTGVTRYELERSSDGGITWTPIYSGPNLTYPETVSCGVYRYRVRACNSCGCGEWRTGSTDCNYTAPPAPANISYPTNDSDGTYTVSWSSAVRATRYELERSSDGGVTWTPIYSGPSASYSDTVSCGIYRYRVRACNSCGCGEWRTGSTDC